MDYVEHLDLFGVEAKEIPCIKGKGAPTTATVGAVGLFYMDTVTGEVYKCVAITSGVYEWTPIVGGTVQTTGESETAVMSQKATTEAIRDITSAGFAEKFNGEFVEYLVNYNAWYSNADAHSAVIEATSGATYDISAKGVFNCFRIYGSNTITDGAELTLIYNGDNGSFAVIDSVMQYTFTNTANYPYLIIFLDYKTENFSCDLSVGEIYGDTTDGFKVNGFKVALSEDLTEAVKKLDKAIEEAKGEEIEVVQTTGESETAVMSQKATTEALRGITNAGFAEKFNGEFVEYLVNYNAWYSNADAHSAVIEATSGATYRISAVGTFNRFRIYGADTLEEGATVTPIYDNGKISVMTDEQYTFINDVNYPYIVISLDYLTENFSCDLSVLELYGDISNGFEVNGIRVALPEDVSDPLDTINESLSSRLPIEFVTKSTQGKIADIGCSNGVVFVGEPITGCAFIVEKNTSYKVTVKGLHNRFYVSLCDNNPPNKNDPAHTVYNSNNSTEREQSESCIINSGDSKSIIVTVGFGMTVTSASVECIAVPNENGIISFGEFDLYTGGKIDSLLTSSVNTAYVTTASVNDVKTATDVYALYDALVAKYPLYITKNTLGQNSLGTPINEYVFTSGNYNDVTTQRNKDEVKAKPVILVLSGVHGYERSAVMATYQFFRDMAEFVPSLYALREELTFKVIPIVTPWSFDNDKRVNENGVNINRNFNYNWRLLPNDGNDYSGAEASDQAETQIVQTWMEENTNAYLCIDHHNSGYVNEVSMISGLNTATNIPQIKEQYLHGLAKIIPFWKGVKNFSDSLIFAYTGFISGNAMAVDYSQDKAIASICIETSWNQNSLGKHSAESIAVGAEAFGNMLLGIYKGI